MDPEYDRVAAETLPSLQEVFPKKLTIVVLIMDIKIRSLNLSRIINMIILSLAVILLASCGGSQDIPITVPTGAKAEDLTMEPCKYEARGVEYAADCGKLIVSIALLFMRYFSEGLSV